MKKIVEVTELKKVESSNIEELAFHDNTTYVRFKGGSLYTYAGTSKEIFDALANAKSIGKHLNSEIKGNFDYEKVDFDLKKKGDESLTILEGVNVEIKKLRKMTGFEAEKKALVLLKAELVNNTKAKKPQDEIKVAKSHYKSLLKTAELYKNNGAVAHADQLVKVAWYIAEFLPKEPSEDEINDAINTYFAANPDKTIRDMGNIIAEIKQTVGANDASLIAKNVKLILTTPVAKS